MVVLKWLGVIVAVFTWLIVVPLVELARGDVALGRRLAGWLYRGGEATATPLIGRANDV